MQTRKMVAKSQAHFTSTRHAQPIACRTAITNVYRASKDLLLAQRFARHASPLTTAVYTHPSDEDLRMGVRDLSC